MQIRFIKLKRRFTQVTNRRSLLIKSQVTFIM
jgi:hypothetical protein